MQNKINNIRKAIILLSLCFLYTIGHAQTKEETITWLKEKLEKCFVVENGGPCRNLIISVNECYIEIKYVRLYSTYGKDFTDHTITIPTSGARISGGYFIHSSKVIHEVVIDKCCEGRWTEDSFKDKRYLLEEREDNIYARIQKALEYLATFCPKTEEPF